MAVLTKDQILTAKDLVRETVEVPEWGGEVIIRCLTVAEREDLETKVLNEKDKAGMNHYRATLASMSIINEQGERLFTEADIDELEKKSSLALERVAKAAARLSKLRKQDIEAETKN